jgi:predicted phage terminase large subunit-like protein
MPAAHHYMIAEKLEAVSRGEIKRLRIHMPPRHGKSELASIRFPAFFMGQHPKRNIIAASYNSDLASDFGRKVRNIAAGREYKAIFDTTLAEDSSAANRWHTNEGGMYAAVGIGTATTGRGAHALIIDDPFKDREEADSETHREKVWRWYTSTAYTRLESEIRIEGDITEDDALWFELLDDINSGDAVPFEGAIIGICTRWHDDDWAGRVEIAEAQGGEKWDVLDLPAIKSDGTALWSAKYPLKRLESIRKTIGERDWSALYQQRPTPDEGDYFKREWFRYYDIAPVHLRTYGASDYAVTAKGGDYTVHLISGVDPDDNLYILDVWRSQAESHVWVETYIDMIAKWKPLKWGQETGQIIKSLGPFIDKRMRERRVYCHQEPMSSVADKPTRARSFQARASMGKVYLPHNAPWVPDLISEMLTFPAGKHDDQIDALGLIGRMLDTMVGGKRPFAPQRPETRWDRAFAERANSNNADSWRVA